MGPCATARAISSPRSKCRSEDVIDKRPFLALVFTALLASCGGEVDEGDAAPGEVLEGSISDAMLPVDRLRSEPPLEDPEVLAEASGGPQRASGTPDTAASESPAAETAETEAAEADPDAAAEGEE
jgi:hypothetical protein